VGCPGPRDHAVALAGGALPDLPQRRDLREQAWRAWTGRGEHAGEHDNREVARDILRLRNEQAGLHGHACYADYALADTMAGSRSAVQGLLDEVWPRALAARAARARCWRRSDARRRADRPIEAWDWRYWAEKVRQQRYALDDAEVKPYFRWSDGGGRLRLCRRLFGLRFTRATTCRSTTPTSRPTRCATHTAVVGLFLQDNFARPSKRSGAWMSSLRWQSRNADAVRAASAELPVILNNNNFAKGRGRASPRCCRWTTRARCSTSSATACTGCCPTSPSSGCRARRCCATSSSCRRSSSSTGSPSPRCCAPRPPLEDRRADPGALMQRLQAARRFNQGYETVRYTASAMVDMAVHCPHRGRAAGRPVRLRGRAAAAPGPAAGWARTTAWCTSSTCSPARAMPPAITSTCGPRCWTPTATTPSSKPATPSTRATVAQRLQRYIYGSGNSLEPGAAYAAFRGRAATVTPLLDVQAVSVPQRCADQVIRSEPQRGSADGTPTEVDVFCKGIEPTAVFKWYHRAIDPGHRLFPVVARNGIPQPVVADDLPCVIHRLGFIELRVGQLGEQGGLASGIPGDGQWVGEVGQVIRKHWVA
jgi:peptidyl-dipeptidase Dcp